MKKATIASPKTMSEDQVREDISMTPLQCLELASKISDFAAELHPNPETSVEESTSIRWIELRKVSPHVERNPR